MTDQMRELSKLINWEKRSNKFSLLNLNISVDDSPRLSLFANNLTQLCELKWIFQEKLLNYATGRIVICIFKQRLTLNHLNKRIDTDCCEPKKTLTS